ncbi:MAG: hypothetical protein ABF946_12570, partial [Acetobacter papayae]
MDMMPSPFPALAGRLSRRRFITGAGALAGLSALHAPARFASAMDAPALPPLPAGHIPQQSASTFLLNIGHTPVHVLGKPQMAPTVNG